MWILSISKGCPLKITDSRKPTADSRNWPAAILLIAGISFTLQFHDVCHGMAIFAISQ
jgi:hypothetical protein